MQPTEVRSHLPSVLEDVEQTREAVIVTRYGKPIASIIPFKEKSSRATRYPLRGQAISLTEDFDEPIPDLWDALAVAEERSVYGTPPPRRRRTKGKKSS